MNIPNEIKRFNKLAAIPQRKRLADMPELGCEDDRDFTLALAQRRIWFLEELLPSRSLFNIPFAVRLSGRLDDSVLQDALNVIVQRHTTLRTTIVNTPDGPMQRVAGSGSLTVEKVDLSRTDSKHRFDEALRQANVDARTPLDLENGPLVKCRLFQLAEDDYLLLLVIHHIVAEVWSISLLFKELSEIYNASLENRIPSLPDLAIQYADFATSQGEALDGQALQRELDYWERQLSSPLPTLQLPTHRPRPAVPSVNGAWTSIDVSPEFVGDLQSFSKRHRVTLFMTLLAGFQVLLSRCCRQSDVIVGSPAAGRNVPETESLIGLFVNTLALRTDLSGNPTFADLLERVRTVCLDAYANQEVPFERIVETVNPERSLNHAPIFQVMLALHNTPRESVKLSGIRTQVLGPDSIHNGCSKCDLTLFAGEISGEFRLGCEYNTDLFNGSTIQRMLGHLEVLLTSMVEDPLRRIADTPLLTSQEQAQFDVWNSTRTELEQLSLPVHKIFEIQVEKTPDAIAVVSEGQQLSYCELNERSNQVAHRLLELGVRPDTLVGLCLGGSANLLVGILGILKAGGAYVPLDIDCPAQRQRYILDDANVEILVTERDLLVDLETGARTVVCIDDGQSAIDQQPNGNPDTECLPSHLAYVMYTSGTTGRPKGVAVEHRSIIRLVYGNHYATFGPDRTFLQLASVVFDASTFEIWGALLHGAKLVVAPLGPVDLRELEHLLDKHKVTTLWLTATLFNQIIEQSPTILQHVEEILTGGEALSVKHVRKAQSILGPKVSLINGYGPTESTTFTTCYRIPHGIDDWVDNIPIGRPISNTQVYVLDEQRQLVPNGVPGELCIGGCGLARGYLNQPELTAEKFIEHPFSDEPDSRLYRTGDLVRWRSDGNLEFISRMDDQVKLRGFRIELGEIEFALQSYPQIGQAVVILRQDKQTAPQLAAYLVLSTEESPKEALNLDLLRNHLSQQLPNYMIPSAFVILDALPKNPNGKLDRRQLPRPTEEHYSHEVYQAPRNELEAKLVQIWQEMLELEKPPSIHDNFFLIGGHSLLAVGVVSKIEDEVGRRLPISVLFERPTISEIAEKLAETRKNQKVADAIYMSRDGEGLPLFILPGVVGDVVVSSDIISGLDCPIIGLQPNFERDDFQLFRDLRETAGHFADLILKHQPIGPYSLFGFSFGGYLAHQVAIELTKRGEDVERLIILDSGPGFRGQKRQLTRSVLRWARITLNLPLWIASELARFEVDRYARRTAGIIKRSLPGFLRNRFPTDPVSEIFDLENIPDQQLQLLYANHDALRHYQPQFYSGAIHLIRARVRSLFSGAPSDLGWSCYTREVEVYTVSGDHESIIRKPRVNSVVDIMNDLLRFRPSNEFSEIHERPDSQEKFQEYQDLAGLMPGALPDDRAILEVVGADPAGAAHDDLLAPVVLHDDGRRP